MTDSTVLKCIIYSHLVLKHFLLFFNTSDLQVAWLEPLLCQLQYSHFDHLAHQFLGEEVSIAEVLSESDIWLLR